MIKTLTTIISSLAVVLSGAAALWFGTGGFKEFTIETARKNAVAEQPFVLSNFKLENQEGQLIELNEAGEGIVIADFIYTQCPTFCQVMGSDFNKLQSYVKESGLEGKVSLLSISFDSVNDDPAALNSYLDRHKADKTIWQGTRVADTTEESALLNEFGVTAIPDQYGGYTHNAAYYLISNNTIHRIYDYSDFNQLLAEVNKRVEAAL